MTTTVVSEELAAVEAPFELRRSGATRLATDGRRRFAPDWRPRALAAGLRAVVSGG